MKTNVLIFCFLIVSISSQTGHSQGENEEEKEYCNLIANPVKLRNEEGDDSSVIACQKMGTTDYIDIRYSQHSLYNCILLQVDASLQGILHIYS